LALYVICRKSYCTLIAPRFSNHWSAEIYASAESRTCSNSLTPSSSSQVEGLARLSPRSAASRRDRWQRGCLLVENGPGFGSEGRWGGVSGSGRPEVVFGVSPSF